MTLRPGTQIGSYEITVALGAGGMGEVYRARDTKLDREAAIKVLPETFGQDTDGVARLRRPERQRAARRLQLDGEAAADPRGGRRALISRGGTPSPLPDEDKNMQSSNANLRRSTRTALLVAGMAALGTPLAFAAEARNGHVTSPKVPANLEVEAGHEAVLVGHATGTQNYVCLPSGSGFAWSLFTPAATLFDDDRHPVITHYFGPNPFEDGTIRAAWQHSRDTSRVWGRAVQSSADPHFVEAGAIPWLLVRVKDVGAQAGPTGGRNLTDTTFIQRVNTHGGAAPGSGCGQPSDVGHRAFVPYSADYVFYEKAAPDGRDQH